MIFTKVSVECPAGHARYVVKRGSYYFVATPCFGMHSPWWVPMINDKELEPIQLLDTDEYFAIPRGNE